MGAGCIWEISLRLAVTQTALKEIIKSFEKGALCIILTSIFKTYNFIRIKNGPLYFLPPEKTWKELMEGVRDRRGWGVRGSRMLRRAFRSLESF